MEDRFRARGRADREPRHAPQREVLGLIRSLRDSDTSGAARDPQPAGRGVADHIHELRDGRLHEYDPDEVYLHAAENWRGRGCRWCCAGEILFIYRARLRRPRIVAVQELLAVLDLGRRGAPVPLPGRRREPVRRLAVRAALQAAHRGDLDADWSTLYAASRSRFRTSHGRSAVAARSTTAALPLLEQASVISPASQAYIDLDRARPAAPRPVRQPAAAALQHQPARVPAGDRAARADRSGDRRRAPARAGRHASARWLRRGGVVETQGDFAAA